MTDISDGAKGAFLTTSTVNTAEELRLAGRAITARLPRDAAVEVLDMLGIRAALRAHVEPVGAR